MLSYVQLQYEILYVQLYKRFLGMAGAPGAGPK